MSRMNCIFYHIIISYYIIFDNFDIYRYLEYGMQYTRLILAILASHGTSPNLPLMMNNCSLQKLDSFHLQTFLVQITRMPSLALLICLILKSLLNSGLNGLLVSIFNLFFYWITNIYIIYSFELLLTLWPKTRIIENNFIFKKRYVFLLIKFTHCYV